MQSYSPLRQVAVKVRVITGLLASYHLSEQQNTGLRWHDLCSKALLQTDQRLSQTDLFYSTPCEGYNVGHGHRHVYYHGLDLAEG